MLVYQRVTLTLAENGVGRLVSIKNGDVQGPTVNLLEGMMRYDPTKKNGNLKDLKHSKTYQFIANLQFLDSQCKSSSKIYKHPSTSNFM